MNDNELTAIVNGEDTNGPKVTVGTGGAFVGVTNSPLNFCSPVCCVNRYQNDIYKDMSFELYFIEVYKRACRIAYKYAYTI